MWKAVKKKLLRGEKSDRKCVNNVPIFRRKELEVMTNKFDVKNFVGLTMFGRLYRGNLPHDWYQNGVKTVLVKILEYQRCGYPAYPNDSSTEINFWKLLKEVTLLMQPSMKMEPNVAKLIGYCKEGEFLAIVYDVDPLNTLHYLILQDSSNWSERINIELEFADLLQRHELLSTNIDAADIIIDKNMKPFHFEMGKLIRNNVLVNPYGDNPKLPESLPSDPLLGLSLSIVADRKRGDVVTFSREELNLITSNFDHFVSLTMFGSLYRGELPKEWDHIGFGATKVTVKKWEYQRWGNPSLGRPQFCEMDKHTRMMNEIRFLMQPSMMLHQNVVNLIGYYIGDEFLALVYNLDPLDTLHNLIVKDHFNWRERVNVLVQFAHLLTFLQGYGYVVRNIDAMHIMMDKDLNPVLFDFGTLTGGIFYKYEYKAPEEPFYPVEPYGSVGYLDFRAFMAGVPDIYSYGVLLTSILVKKVIDKEWQDPLWNWKNEADKWVMEGLCEDVMRAEKTGQTKQAECCFSIVETSLQHDPAYVADDGYALTNLAIQCLGSLNTRPEMKDIVNCLHHLIVVKEPHMQQLVKMTQIS
ncbi:hypothetical protein CCACVL1_18247 [Corchorus capsularis]|uniref:Protein kinase domain-containing protein n=1 Tax=Corchorus capsularis TaxID=210143 RepID=A0A1R3HM40_COCAP|nr:hypothetical protein CCACVL1_18247 [Corchorus capsularis]